MTIKFTHAEIVDLARRTLQARGFSAKQCKRFTARIACNHKAGSFTVILEDCHPELVEGSRRTATSN